MSDQKMRRNLNPHRSARMAMILYNQRYAAQKGGSMDFWDTLTEGEKCICRECVQEVMEAPPELAEKIADEINARARKMSPLQRRVADTKTRKLAARLK